MVPKFVVDATVMTWGFVLRNAAPLVGLIIITPKLGKMMYPLWTNTVNYWRDNDTGWKLTLGGLPKEPKDEE